MLRRSGIRLSLGASLASLLLLGIAPLQAEETKPEVHNKAQIQQANTNCKWPPKAANLVNLDSDNAIPIVVPDGGVSPAAIYTVPDNKYLIVTDFEIVNRLSIGVGGQLLYPTAHATPLQLLQDVNGTYTVKRGALFTGNHNGVSPGPFTGVTANGPNPRGAQGYHSSGVGLVFEPGSQVRLGIRDPNSVDPSSGAVVVVEYTLSGYLSN